MPCARSALSQTRRPCIPKACGPASAVTVPPGHRGTPLAVGGEAVLGGTLRVSGELGRDLTVLRARRVHGRFARVLAPAGVRATVSYSRTSVTVRLRPA